MAALHLKNKANPGARINTVTSMNIIRSAGYEADRSLRLIMIFCVSLFVFYPHAKCQPQNIYISPMMII